MTTITPTHEPTPPRGAEPDYWAPFDGDRMYRVVLGPLLTVAGRNEVSVQSSAIQFDDGEICTSDHVIEAPRVFVSADGDSGLSPDQARELASHITQAADLAEQWVAEAAAR